MYRQILVGKSQWPLQTIMWRKSPSEELEAFQLRTVTYGTSSAPWLAVRCLQQLSKDFTETFPRSSHIVAKDFYMDDLLTTVDTTQEAIQVCDEVSFILSSGCFQLQKWASNSTAVLHHVKGQNPSAVLKIGDGERTKTLGLYWSCASDNLMYTISQPSSFPITKRSILSDIAQVFDPLGLVGPCIILGKIILQSIWLHKLQWDESLPADLDSKWRQFREQLPCLNQLKVPRHVVSTSAKRIELHGFSDASLEAYGACLYVRSVSDSGIEVKLLCAKTKVAPLKALTVPKLELCGALLLAQLTHRVKESMTISYDDILLWSDSTVCLSWIRMQPNRLQVFVQNRVAQIQELTQQDSWNYVRTAENPADLLSRGVFPENLRLSVLWWSGPKWLSKPQEDWPISHLNFEGELPELRRQRIALPLFQKVDILGINRFSTLSRIQRVTAYCQRFILNSKPANSKKERGPLSISELSNALTLLTKLSQEESFLDEIACLRKGKPLNRKSRLLSLNPFLDDTGVLRVGGRLQLSDFDYGLKHPAILSSKHHFTKLLFQQEHIRLLHAGPQQLLFSIRQRFWALSGRNLAKKIVHSCIRCFRCSPSQFAPIMGSLPRSRVTPDPPFHTIGVDYAGPITIKSRSGRGAKTNKAYIALFVCFSTKAVHLELVSDLTKEAFIAAFRRFTARRGKPFKVYSDNGTNFVGANSELCELAKFLKTNQAGIQESILNTGVDWHFVPAFSPHFGGIWEAGVKSAKKHLKRVLANSILPFEEYSTVLTEVEAILNSRPITPLSNDPSDLSSLTPSHFLMGRVATSLPDPDLQSIKTNRLSKYQHLQQLQQRFWTRWSSEYITELQSRTKWKAQSQQQLRMGAMVILRDDHKPPLQWQLGRIVAVHPGPDNIARVASVQTSGGVVKRAFSKMCVLPIETTPDGDSASIPDCDISEERIEM